MSEYQVEVRITPRQGLLDPQGSAIQDAIRDLEFSEVSGVRVGRLVRFRLTADSEAVARDRINAICERLLVNPVTEDFEIVLEAVR